MPLLTLARLRAKFNRSSAAEKLRLRMTRAGRFLLERNDHEVDAMMHAPTQTESSFGRPWFARTGAFALHVLDEATTGFLSIYNPR